MFDTNPFLQIMNVKLRTWLVILNAMLDIGVNSLPRLCLHGGMENEFRDFVTILSRYNAHLKELSVHFQVRSCYFISDFGYS